MGISGLLPALKSITRRGKLEDFRGQTAAVDVFGWLHRGAYCCSTEICLSGDWSKCVAYCMKRVEMLLHFGVRPLMVFDGGYLPMKGDTESERRSSREKNLELGKQLYAKGQLDKANQAFVKAVDVTPEMALELISALKARGVDFVVAPYEADAQIAYLCMTQKADFALSEDSDCLAFGCRKVFFKLDHQGEGDVIDMSRLAQNRNPNLHGFTYDMFLDMCILSGCDYLPSLHGMGVKSASKLVQKYRTTPRILRGLRFEGTYKVPQGFESQFYKARMAFLHHVIFTFQEKQPRMERLRPVDNKMLLLLEERARDLAFAGKILDSTLAQGIARGEINPFSHEPFTLNSVSGPGNHVAPQAVLENFFLPTSPKRNKKEHTPVAKLVESDEEMEKNRSGEDNEAIERSNVRSSKHFGNTKADAQQSLVGLAEELGFTKLARKDRTPAGILDSKRFVFEQLDHLSCNATTTKSSRAVVTTVTTKVFQHQLLQQDVAVTPLQAKPRCVANKEENSINGKERDTMSSSSLFSSLDDEDGNKENVSGNLPVFYPNSAAIKTTSNAAAKLNKRGLAGDGGPATEPKTRRLTLMNKFVETPDAKRGQTTNPFQAFSFNSSSMTTLNSSPQGGWRRKTL